MAGDPAIRWQVMRDLMHRPASAWQPEQARVARVGWGARLLARQGADGRWTPRFYGAKWISTTYSMMLLRHFGLPPGHAGALRACTIFLDEGLQPDGGINPTASIRRSEACVTGMVLGLVSWFGLDDERRERLVEYLLEAQMPDGGWNCERDRGASHASFHTTINVLEGLRDYAVSGGPRARATERAEHRGREFFLRHRLYRSHRTGRVADHAFTRFAFPPRWHHDILRTLDYFRTAGEGPQARLDDPISIVLSRRDQTGRWRATRQWPGRSFFQMERAGEASRWNTLRALRVLEWYGRA